jgi:hypothetical protein
MKSEVRLEGDESDVSVEFFQPPACACEGTCGTQACCEMGNARLAAKYLRSGGVIMSLPVGVVLILVCVEVFVRMLRCEVGCYLLCLIRPTEP